MLRNGSQVNGSTAGEHALHRPPWVTTTLGCFLIFTILVDILGNLFCDFLRLQETSERRHIENFQGKSIIKDTFMSNQKSNTHSLHDGIQGFTMNLKRRDLIPI
ncbi:hypothetical protein KOW79_001832 [Hemibagrus wyckioides]|uniref:Uncharacterized protein n=1 Tax=Hemibagrus wyckioides TaxID=337641 RepID=A0A9D3P726_9TELE|nr:hypothetical protein KOW79_001832 [Hemibagrus wyckioides]